MEERFGTWVVDDDGMVDDGGYEIEHGRMNILDETGAMRLPFDLLTKTWVDPETFIPALKRCWERHADKSYVKWELTQAALTRWSYAKACRAEAERRLGTTDRLFDPKAIEIMTETQRLMECGWYPPGAEREEARREHAEYHAECRRAEPHEDENEYEG
jgi:hypothetical protein